MQCIQNELPMRGRSLEFRDVVMLTRAHVLCCLLCCPVACVGGVLADSPCRAVRPADFVDAASVVPGLQVDMRYAGAHNFIGRPVAGYEAPRCLLTSRAAHALAEVQRALQPMGLGLKVYDCYRPQRAADAMLAWSRDVDDQTMRDEFYREVDKSELFDKGYVAARSGHSRGSTVDLSIVELGSRIPQPPPGAALRDCRAPAGSRYPDNSLDFGTGYDCFSVASHPASPLPSAQARANRLLLRMSMQRAGFAPLATEWWHFSLVDEPYPHTFFDFPVR
jgi:D-alanyl-D-alanine dipeptidase